MFIGRFFKYKKTRVWFIVTAVVLAFVILINVLASTVFYSLLSIVLGRERAILGTGVEPVYFKKYQTKEEARLAGNAVNERIVEEGIVMLKNQDALPLQQGAKISVFGKNSVNLVYGGSGSGGGTNKFAVSIFESLTQVGFSYNPVLKGFYESSASGEHRSRNPEIESGNVPYLNTGETPQSMYTDNVKNSYANYKDAALIVISRIGGEGWDLPRSMGENAYSEGDHYLQLDKNERDLIKAVCEAGFPKVIIILNSNNPIELGFLDDEDHYAYDSRINGCLWIGTPGDTGIMALGRILKGQISPSGRLVDTYARNFKNDPVWVNFGDDNGQRYNDSSYRFIDYEEGIYLGYRYYETRGHIEGETWYRDNVVFPFGYGLSYTTFTQQITNKEQLNNKKLTKDVFSVEVKVTNTGAVAGKETVQIYVTPPYEDGKIEKPHVVLAGFAKTPLIEPGTFANVKIDIDPYYIASYDFADKNGNGFKGYELDAGDYIFKLSRNAHEVIDTFTLNVESGIRYEKDPVTDYDVVNRYEDADDELGSLLSRTNFAGTMPQARTQAEKALSSQSKAALDSVATNNPINVPISRYPMVNAEGNLSLKDILDKDYEDEVWDELLDMLSISEMVNLVTDGQFKTAAVPSINVPATIAADGPFGFVNFMGDPTVYDCCYYASEVVLASTWNIDLAEELGEAVGDESLIGNERGDKLPYSGWYAPGLNIHRSPFGGRAGEYFSEDPFLSGKMGANEVKGARSKGVITFIKHFAVNEQETHRMGAATWLNEQSLREIYLRPFEIAVKEGQTLGVMSAFNRIGTMWTGGDYRLLTEILRNEWGFRGAVVSDYNSNNKYMDARQMIYAGGDIHLFAINSKKFTPNYSSATDITILRNATKNILYAVANSNIRDCDVVGYKAPIWVVCMYIADAVIAAGLALWGALAIRKMLKANAGSK